MKSFQLLRTNPALTTNIYIVVNDKIYLESINSSDELNDLKLKRKPLNSESLYEYKIADFWKDWSPDLIYYVRNNEDPQYVYDDYSVQYDDIYRSGGDYISDTWYDEEFEYFAPLWVNKNNLPKWFFIFRVDGHSYDELTPQNLKSKILNKLKFVENWDLTQNTIGEFITNNIKRKEFPEASLYISYKSLDMSKIKGFNLNGGFVERYRMLDDIWIKNIPYYNLEKIITEEYKATSTVYPLIWNFKFLFNDSPADVEKYKKYSINRYYGFYIDNLEEIYTYTPYVLGYIFKENLKIRDYYTYIVRNNVFYKLVVENNLPVITDNQQPLYTTIGADPFLGGWNDSRDTNYWFWYNNNFYKITRTLNTDWTYSIVADIYITIENNNVFDLTDYNNHLITFKSNGENNIYHNNTIIDLPLDSDIYVSHMTKWTTVQKGTVGINLYADYAINSDIKSISYTLAGQTETISLNLTSVQSPPVLRIYRAKLLDIKDFDFNRTDTDFTRYEYEDLSKNSDSTEPKLSFKEWLDSTISTNYLEDINKVKLVSGIFDDLIQSSIPVSTEYVVNAELFYDNEILSKNQSVCKWGIIDSVHIMNYPYRLYNGSDGGWFNFGPNLLSEASDWKERNFDYCYFNWPVGNIKSIYPYNSVHIWNSDSYLIGESFDYKKLMNTQGRTYFDSFFKTEITYNAIPSDKKNNILNKEIQKKYGTFNFGDKDNPCYCVFKGIKYVIKKVLSITPKSDQSTIDEIIVTNTDQYNDYDFSVIMHFSKNAKRPTYRLKDEDIIQTSGDIYYAKYIINIAISTINKTVVISIEIPCGKETNITDDIIRQANIDYNNNINLNDIFNYKIKDNYQGRIDRFLYRDNPKYNDWTSSPLWKNSTNNTIYIQNTTEEILLDNVELLTAYNIINFINNFSSNEEQQTQLVDINYNIDGNDYNLNNQWGDITTTGIFTLPIIITIEQPENYTFYNSYEIQANNVLNVELQIDNKIQTVEESPIIKNINYLKTTEPISYTYKELIRNDVFTMSSINQYDAISMFRYNGWYDVIYKDLNLHNGYKFNTELTQYGQVEEIISKINPQGSILKTKNSTPQVTPRIDEWGYSIINNFIFRSCWDKNFYLKFYVDARDAINKTNQLNTIKKLL
jgi:hypothetical protein